MAVFITRQQLRHLRERRELRVPSKRVGPRTCPPMPLNRTLPFEIILRTRLGRWLAQVCHRPQGMLSSPQTGETFARTSEKELQVSGQHGGRRCGYIVAEQTSTRPESRRDTSLRQEDVSYLVSHCWGLVSRTEIDPTC
jgi:hypothetical protein